MKVIITVVSDKENYTFVVKDSLCFAERPPRNVWEKLFIYIMVIGLHILNKKEEISKIRFICVPIQIPQSQ